MPGFSFKRLLDDFKDSYSVLRHPVGVVGDLIKMVSRPDGVPPSRADIMQDRLIERPIKFFYNLGRAGVIHARRYLRK